MEERALDNVNAETAAASGWKTHAGNPDNMVVLAKASFDVATQPRIMHSTKAVEIKGDQGPPHGCIVEMYSEVGGRPMKAVVWLPGIAMNQLKKAYGADCGQRPAGR